MQRSKSAAERLRGASARRVRVLQDAREHPRDAAEVLGGVEPSPVTRFFEGGRVSQTLDGVSKTLFDST